LTGFSQEDATGFDMACTITLDFSPRSGFNRRVLSGVLNRDAV